ncbi:MAG TPA: lysylphosphatidylglycerol synthase transmembrane domain-containing protein [Vicinamibacterales bacterium]
MRAHLRTVVVIGLALALLAWFLRGANFALVWTELTRGRLDLLLLALIATMMTYALRARRWQYLLAGLGPTRFVNAFRATVIGFAASFLLPARAGEFLRPYLLAQRERLSATAAFATVVLERVFDMATVLVLFACFLLTSDPALARSDPAMFRAVQVGGLTAAAATVGILGVFYFLAGHPEAIGRLSERIERRLPERLRSMVEGLAQTFAVGLGAVRRPQQLLLVFVWSFPLWLSIAAGIWLTSRAFSVEMGFTGSFLVMTLLVVGVAVPTPGSIGGFHKFYQIGVTSFFHASTEKAISAALVLHAISFVPVTLLGIVFMAQEGLTLGRMRRLASDAGAAEEEAR